MPPKKKGNKNKKPQEETKRDLEIKGPMEEYGKILKMLGSGQLRVVLSDSREVFGRIAGRFKRRGRRRVWMKPGDVVLLSYRSFQDTVYDVVHLYKPDEVRSLLTKDEIPQFFCDASAITETNDVIEFNDIQEIPNNQTRIIEFNIDNIDDEYETMSIDMPVDKLGNTIY